MKLLIKIIFFTVKGVDDADNGQFGQHPRTYNRLFELLSCKRLHDAVMLAERTGMYRLALLLSQLDGDASVPLLVRNQLNLWKVTEADLTMAPELLKLYRLLAGTVVVEDGTSGGGGDDVSAQCSLLGLGWLRGVGVLFWYCAGSDSFTDNISTLSSALDSYRIVQQDGFADAPVSTHRTDRDPLGADVSFPTAVNGLYTLLELLFPSSSSSSNAGSDFDGGALELEIRNNVITALKPSGYTRDALDYRASYLLLVMLESAEISHIDATHAHIIRQHYISQLLGAGLWQWALFVALQVPDLSARYCLVSDIVLRFGYGGEGGGAFRGWDSKQDEQLFHFLTVALNIPGEMLHEAAAYRAGYEHRHRQQVSCLISAGRCREATEVTVTHIAPAAILSSGSASQRLLLLLETIAMQQQDMAVAAGRRVQATPSPYAYADHWADLSQVFLTFLRLKEAVESMAAIAEVSAVGADSINSMAMVAKEVPHLANEARQLMQRLTTLHQQRKETILSSSSSSNYRKGKSNARQATAVVAPEQKLIQIVLYDMATYVYCLLQGLEMTTVSEAERQDADSLVQRQVQHLLSRDHLERAPVLSEKRAAATSMCTSSFLRAAANRLVPV